MKSGFHGSGPDTLTYSARVRSNGASAGFFARERGSFSICVFDMFESQIG